MTEPSDDPPEQGGGDPPTDHSAAVRRPFDGAPGSDSSPGSDAAGSTDTEPAALPDEPGRGAEPTSVAGVPSVGSDTDSASIADEPVESSGNAPAAPADTPAGDDQPAAPNDLDAAPGRHDDQPADTEAIGADEVTGLRPPVVAGPPLTADVLGADAVAQEEDTAAADALPRTDEPTATIDTGPISQRDPQRDPEREELQANGSGPSETLPARRWLGIAAVVVVVALLGLAAFLVGRDSDDADVGAETTTTAAPEQDEPAEPVDPGEIIVPDQFVVFEDPETGISLAHPEAWERLDIEGLDESVRLSLTAGGLNSVLVRVVTLDAEITEDNLADVSAVTDGIITDGEVEVLEKVEITINGMPGYYYLYFFTDEETGEQGVHAHYFLFQGSTMNIVVFQALPTAAFDTLAPIFDQIAATIRSDPPDGEAPESTTTTTSPPTTTG